MLEALMMRTVMNAQRPARLYTDRTVRSNTNDWAKPLLNIKFDHSAAVAWVDLTPMAPPHVSLQLLHELSALSSRIREGRYGVVRYKILSSSLPSIFSLGGDLELFLRSINSQDRSALCGYGRAAIDEVWANVTGCGAGNLTSVAIVEGEAQGGGFEAALSCHLIVAEEGTSFGFPESLFGLFPGMGAAHLLAVRTDKAVATRLISNSHRYSAEFLKDIGVIDYVVPKGTARTFTTLLINRS